MKLRHSISLLLALVLLLSMTIPAYAEEIEPTVVTGQESETLTVESPAIPVSLESEEVYTGDLDNSVMGVSITWEVETLIIEATHSYGAVWNPAILQYERGNISSTPGYGVDCSGSESHSGGVVHICTVTNLSLFDVKVTPSINPADALANAGCWDSLSAYCDEDILSKATAPEYAFTDELGTAGGSTGISINFNHLGNNELDELYNLIKENNLNSIGTVSLSFSKVTS